MGAAYCEEKIERIQWAYLMMSTLCVAPLRRGCSRNLI